MHGAFPFRCDLLETEVMPQDAAKNGRLSKPPGGRRVGLTEVERRLDHVERMMRDGRTRADVVASMAATFGVSPRAADEYIRRARERLATEAKGTREAERSATIARLDRLSKKAEARGAFGAAVNAERLRAQVLGLMAPQAVEVSANVNTVVDAASSPEDADLTPEQIDEELEAIADVLRVSRDLARGVDSRARSLLGATSATVPTR